MATKASILVTDDEVSTLKTLAAELEELDYQVTTATTGREALSLIRKNPFNIVIADIRLPDISGLEILEVTKELNAEAAVVMITGYASIETAVNAINEGAYAYILKPVAMNELETIINNALREQWLLIENRKLVEELQRSNKRLEAANHALEQVNQAKSDFMAKMSHELRTPLNSIIGFAEVLRNGAISPTDEPTRNEFLDYIYISGKHLLNLINGILDLAKIESGKMTLEPSEFELAELLDDVKMTVLPVLATKQQTLEMEIAPNITTIFADQLKMKQVFLNLISNAHKFSPGKGRIRIVCRLESPGQLHCSVVDNGIGISPQDQQKIFAEFSQVRRGAASWGEGIGLGLVITRRLVELHGGSIWVVSEVGHGSTFTFSIPLVRGKAVVH